MTKEIPLTKGKTVLVDDEDFDYLNQWKWYCNNGRYARRTHKENGKQVGIIMHRLIMKAQPGQFIDHINGNTFDCRKENMRFATIMQNRWNQTKKFSNPSGYRGVTWHKQCQRWQARIIVNWKAMRLGMYDNPVDGAIAYDNAARLYHGEFARTNFKTPPSPESS